MFLFSEYVEMKNKQEQFSALYLQLAEQIEVIVKTVRALSIPWEGEANRRYLMRLEADLIRIENIMGRLYFASDMLREMIAQYQKTEGVIAEMIGGICL